VYIDLHETIEHPERGTLHLRDMLHPPDRPPTTAVVYQTDPPRTAPEPPRFATKFYEEFSGRQTTLKSFFGGGAKRKLISLSPSPTGTPPVESSAVESQRSVFTEEKPSTPVSLDNVTIPFSLARAAFDSLDAATAPITSGDSSKATSSSISDVSQPSQLSSSRPRRPSEAIDMTDNDAEPTSSGSGCRRKPNSQFKDKPKPAKSSSHGQTTLASFFAPPSSRENLPSPVTPSLDRKRPLTTSASHALVETLGDSEEDALVAQAIAEADAEKAERRAAKNAQAAPMWSNLFAKKLPPLCTVHQKPCKDFSNHHLLHEEHAC
jgi:AP endonuclease-2